MDDILQRMLSAEKEAEELSRKKSDEGQALLGAARKQAAKMLEEAQNALTKELQACRDAILEEGKTESTNRLNAAEEELSQKIKAFQAKIAPLLPRVVSALAGNE